MCAVAATQGGALYLLAAILSPADRAWAGTQLTGAEMLAVQVQAATLLARLTSLPGHGTTVSLLIQVGRCEAFAREKIPRARC